MPLNEGQTVQYTVVTTRVADGTTLYWKTTGNTTTSDIVGGNTGSVTITNNQGVFNVTTSSDVNTDGTKTLGIALSTGSQNGPTVVSTANPIVIEDTSLSPGPERLYSWGHNYYGGLGLGDSGNYTRRSSPTQVGSDTTWNLISKSNYRSMATKTDGTLWAWGGDNNHGLLGLNDIADRNSPSQVGTNTNWNLIVVGMYQTIATKTDGTLWMWGKNNYGQLGQNSSGDSRSSPVQVGLATNWNQIYVGGNNTLATKTDGTLWAWGQNNNGTLGFSDIGRRSSPTQVGSATNWSKIVMSRGPSSISVMAIKSDGTLWAWGSNSYGILGLNDSGFTTYRSSPTQVGSDTTWNLIHVESHSMAIKTNGTLWLWGLGDYGQLGQNNQVSRSSPIQVGSTTNWSQVSADSDGASFATKTDGTLWAWGKNSFGQLGLNDSANNYGIGNRRSSPTQIGSATNWSKITSGTHSSMAIASN